MKKYIKLFYIILSFTVSVIMELVIYLPQKMDYLLLVGLFLFSWLLLFIPVSSFVYSKKILINSNKNIPNTLLYSFVISLSYLVLFFKEGESYLYALGIFAWCELWALLGLIGKRTDKRSEEYSSKQ